MFQDGNEKEQKNISQHNRSNRLEQKYLSLLSMMDGFLYAYNDEKCKSGNRHICILMRRMLMLIIYSNVYER